jgi:hypothetical protein
MNKCLIIAAMMAASLANTAAAQTVNVGAASGSQSNSNSQAGSHSSVNIQNSRGYRQVGTAIAPGLIAGGITCQGSASIGAGGPGWGFAFGSTKLDRDCNTRENAKMIALMGERDVAREVMCNVPEVRAAMARVGRPCAGDARVAARNGKRSPYRATSEGLFGAPRVSVARLAREAGMPAVGDRRRDPYKVVADRQ